MALIVNRQVNDGTNWSLTMEILRDLEEKCRTPVEKLKQVADDLVEQMNAGLASDNCSFVKMLISYVNSLPTGNEVGMFYALDLGGTNFRIIRAQLGGQNGGIKHQETVKVVIPPQLMIGTSNELFDYIASELAKFVAKEDQDLQPCSGRRELGFTFSFPVMQTSIDSGSLIKWTKGFSVSDMVGKDVVEELRKALEKQGVNMHVRALVNDTIGTLDGGRFSNKDVIAAVILGTGTNAAYVEQSDEIHKWHGQSPSSGEMVINTEWGNFQSSHFPLTEYDEAVDRDSLNYGEQIYEKMLSGMYLTDIVSRVLCRLAEEASFFGDTGTLELRKPSFWRRTLDMLFIHNDSSPDLRAVGAKMRDLFPTTELSLEKRKIILEICNIVITRGARLAAAGILGILKKVGRDTLPITENQKTVIAMNGGVFEYYTKFRECLMNTLKELVGEQVWEHISIEHVKDGSGIGAALIAASHSRLLP